MNPSITLYQLSNYTSHNKNSKSCQSEYIKIMTTVLRSKQKKELSPHNTLCTIYLAIISYVLHLRPEFFIS